MLFLTQAPGKIEMVFVEIEKSRYEQVFWFVFEIH